MTQGGLKYYIENKENKSFIVRKEIENFIEYYVNFIGSETSFNFDG